MRSTSGMVAASVLGLICAACQPAGAITVVDLVGDKDGFGVPGAPAVPADGTRWSDDLGGVFFTDYRDAGDLANAPFTDIWDSPLSFSYTHSYDLGGLTALSAVLDIQIAGIGDVDLTSTYAVEVNSVPIGAIPPNANPDNFQEVWLYSFNIPINLISGSDSIQVTAGGGDGFTVNFSELRIEVAPEPTTVGSIAVGMVALLGFKRRNNRKV